MTPTTLSPIDFERLNTLVDRLQNFQNQVQEINATMNANQLEMRKTNTDTFSQVVRASLNIIS
jgi:coproporphyrinogen III oxidase-like Fe-S oxidoreductase